MEQPIRGKAGVIEEPLNTIGERITDQERLLLGEITEEVVSEASIPQKARWWLSDNSGKAIFAAGVVGLLTGYGLRRRI